MYIRDFPWNEIWHYISYPFNVLYIIIIIFIIILIILENGSPLRTISWILVFVLLPVVGFILYFYIGRNFRKEKIFSRKGIEDYKHIEELSKKQIIDLQNSELLSTEKVKEKKNIMILLLNNSKALLTQYNKVDILNNGKETFKSILNAIEQAKEHIHLEYYIIEDDIIGNKLKDVLIRKAKEGVEVRLIYDDVGSWSLSKKYIRELKQNGIEVYAFMPVRFSRLADRVNYRNHRKILVIDGETGYVGGINIADRYISGTKELGLWRDIHLKIEGQAVHSLQAVFLIDWFFVSDKIITDDKYFKEHKVEEKKFVQIAACGPDSDWASIMQAYFAAISSAKEYIYISTPYFIPNESILTALKTASLSGLDVRILLPKRTDSHIVYWGSISYVKELLEAGIKIYLYNKGFVHSKILMVDDVFSSVGSANIDIRSFDTNFEINALIYDEETTIKLKTDFCNDLTGSEEVTLEQWLKRPILSKIKSSTSRIISPLF
jgi:cardiolipin synthase A/B